MRPAVIERHRMPPAPENERADVARDHAATARPALPSGPGPAKLDPLVEALGQAIARSATRDRTLSAA